MAAETVRLDCFPESNLLEVTTLGADVAATATTATLENIDNVAADSYLIFALPGSEQAEVRKVESVNGQIVTLTAALSFAHKKYERVTRLRGNQIRLYKATNVDGTPPGTSSFALETTVTIPADQTYVEYTVTTGGSGYWYRQTFYNSTTLVETELGDSPARRGGGYGGYATVERVRLEAGIKDNLQVTDEAIAELVAESVSTVNAYLLRGHYTLPLSAPYPGIIVNVTAKLAASMLLTRDHGVGAEGSSKDGAALRKEAMETLAMIASGELPVVDDNTLAQIAGDENVNGWPDSTTDDAADDEGGGTRKFWANQKL